MQTAQNNSEENSTKGSWSTSETHGSKEGANLGVSILDPTAPKARLRSEANWPVKPRLKPITADNAVIKRITVR